MKFKVLVQKHNSGEISFMLEFENPQEVSTSDKWDVLQITFLKPWMFRGSRSYTTIKTECKSCFFEISKPVPTQISDKALGQSLLDSAESGGQFLRVI